MFAIFYHSQGQFGILQPLGIATFLQCNRRNKGGLVIAVGAFKRQQPQQLFKTTVTRSFQHSNTYAHQLSANVYLKSSAIYTQKNFFEWSVITF